MIHTWTGASHSCVLATHASREKEGSFDDPIKDETEFIHEMRKHGFNCMRRWFQHLTVPAGECLGMFVNINVNCLSL